MSLKKDIDFDEIALEIFNEQNKIRQNPKSYIEKLKRSLTFFKNKIFRHPLEIPLETNEGTDGVKDAIEFLKTQGPVRELKFSEELTKAAKEHALDIGAKGLSSHEGSDGSGISDRVERYIEWDGAIAECLDFCYRYAENIIMNLVVDDGAKEKNQRKNLFNDEFNYVGIAFNPHRSLKYCCVIVYAKGLHPIGEEAPDVINSISDYIDKTMNVQEKRSDNLYQNDDPDAPQNTINMKIIKFRKVIGGKERAVVRKIYMLDNGRQHMVEIEDKE